MNTPLKSKVWIKELKEFQSGKEDEGIMTRHAWGYTDAQLQALAQWFSTQTSSKNRQ